MFVPYPGTDLYAKCTQEGFIAGFIDLEIERAHATVGYPKFTKKQWPILRDLRARLRVVGN